MNYVSYCYITPRLGLIAVRYFGWGFLLHHENSQVQGENLLLVPVWPGWRFAWLAPWL